MTWFSIDKKGSYLRMIQPTCFEVFDSLSGCVSKGNFCVLKPNDEHSFILRQGNLSLYVEHQVALNIFEVLETDVGSADAYMGLDGSIYCRAIEQLADYDYERLTQGDYSTNGLCITVFADDLSGSVDFMNYTLSMDQTGDNSEYLRLNTYLGEMMFDLEEVRAFYLAEHNQYYLGYTTQKILITENLYTALSNCNRAVNHSSEETLAFGIVESFAFEMSPTEEEREKLIQDYIYQNPCNHSDEGDGGIPF